MACCWILRFQIVLPQKAKSVSIDSPPMATSDLNLRDKECVKYGGYRL